jgi:hypothetical protein
MFARSHLNRKKLYMVVCTYYPSNGGKPEIGESWSRITRTKKRVTISEITKAKRAGDTTQVVEHLPNKCKALNSNSCTAKKKCNRNLRVIIIHKAVQSDRKSNGFKRANVCVFQSYKCMVLDRLLSLRF